MNVISVETTPNPDALKFVIDEKAFDRSISFLNAASAGSNALATELFKVAGVSGLLFLGNFVTVSKEMSAKWPTIRKKVAAILTKYSAPQ